jgi:hypothetical protein
MFIDIYGNEIELGDEVAYVHDGLEHGKVTGFTKKLVEISTPAYYEWLQDDLDGFAEAPEEYDNVFPVVSFDRQSPDRIAIVRKHNETA